MRSIGLGISSETSLIRTPKPPQKITTFIFLMIEPLRLFDVQGDNLSAGRQGINDQHGRDQASSSGTWLLGTTRLHPV
jgi:hypothetical protein